jgi:hypothetical protein
VLLVAPQRVAETVVVPVAAVVALPDEIVEITDVFEMFQVTEFVTSWVPLTPLNVALAVKVTVWLTVVVRLFPPLIKTCRVCTTGQTLTVCEELVTVPSDALTLVVDGKVLRVDNAAAFSLPGLLKLATEGAEEVHTDLPVTSPVLPSL